MLNCNVFKSVGSAEDRHTVNVGRLKNEIFDYYGNLTREEKQHVTQIQNFTDKMLGTRTKPKCKTKAAEARRLLPFAVKMCNEHRSSIGVTGKLLEEAGECLLDFQQTMDEHPRVLERTQRQDHPAHR